MSVPVSGGDTLFYGVTGQLRQVLSNLVSNAVDAVPVDGRVRLSASANAEGLEIAVQDEGSGMSEETRRSLFEPFHSTKGDLRNGLELYISQEIMDRHNGSISVETRLGEGTTMTMHLRSAPASGAGLA